MRRSHILIIVGMLLLAFVPRYMIADRAIWFDERFTLLNTGSVSAAVEHCLKDVHPPLYFVLTALWRAAFPSTEVSMRFLSLIFGMASLVGIYLVGRVIAGWRAGLVGATIAALYPYHWVYSTDLRPYAMFLAFSAFSTWAFLCILKEGNLRYFLLLALFTLLNLYTHYFAIFLLAAQTLVFFVILLGYSSTGRWTHGYRNKQLLYAIAAITLVAVAYAPWAGILRRIVTESVVDGRVVGAGTRIGRGVTVKLVCSSLFDSLGQGPLPFLIHSALLAWALVDRRLREASLLVVVTWALPILLLLVWKPAHFIAPKYFIFAYPITVAMVAAGLCSFGGYLKAKGVKAEPVFWVLVIAVSLVPLLPGQHRPYAFHSADWKAVLADVEQRLGHGDRICFASDSKTYAMIKHYSDKDFFKRYPVILWRPKEGGAPFISLEDGTQVWFLRPGNLPVPLVDGLGARLELIETWHLYPKSVHLYRFTAGDDGGTPLPAIDRRGER